MTETFDRMERVIVDEEPGDDGAHTYRAYGRTVSGRAFFVDGKIMSKALADGALDTFAEAALRGALPTLG